MRVPTLFMGSDPIALPFLRALPEIGPEIELRGVFTQPDRPRGRGKRLQANAIKQWAEAGGLPLRQPRRCGPEDEAWIRSEGIELVLVMAFGQLLRSSFLEVAPRGIYNLHTSLLPAYRGASPIQTALAEGETVTGTTLMRIVPEMDAGPVIDAERVVITAEKTAPDLNAALAEACLPLLGRALPRLLSGEAREHPQDSGAATYCRRLFKEDAALDFEAPARVLERRIRAFQPWPGSVMKVDGIPLKIGAARLCDSPGGNPGSLHHPTPGRLVVTCGEEALELLELQRPGGRLLPVDAFLRGFEIPPHAIAAGAPMAPLVSRRPFPWRWRPGDPLEGLREPPPHQKD